MKARDLADGELLERDIARVVVPRDEIAERVEELARQIAECYRGGELIVLAVLTGSLIFLSDLVRRLPLRIRLNVMSASSYPGQATQPQKLRLKLPPEADLTGKHVLVVDDILDSGRTLQAIVRELESHEPASVRTCVLLKKNRTDAGGRIEPDFCGFSVEAEFVVGYGLDLDNLYRDLPDICVLKPHIVSAPTGGGAQP